jgi:hypothetical protein
MSRIANLSPKFRPPRPSLDNGRVQRRVRRAFITTDKPVLSTSQIVEFLAPAPIDTMRGVLSVASVSATASGGSTVRYTKLAPDRFKGFWKD